MSRRISERDLILPALFCIADVDEISTSDLADCLRSLLKPEGEDLEILAGRNDDKFSQKVRNLRSHETLERDGLAIYESRGRQGYWKITETGKAYLEANRPLLDYVLGQGFSYEIQQDAFEKVSKPEKSTTVLLFDERILEQDISISEGKQSNVKRRIYERSKLLREQAIRYFSQDGKIRCAACGFDFVAVYGEHGAGFIEIHHTKPIFSYEEEDSQKTLKAALENLVPLCSNCHRMIHHKREKMLTIEELREIIQSNKN
jgi:5-methylcytosine-specific restriction enzyme A